MNSANKEIFKKLEELNTMVKEKLNNRSALFTIERDSILHTCRQLYLLVSNIEEASAVANDQAAFAANEEISKLKAQLTDLSDVLESYKEVEKEQLTEDKRQPNWEESVEARYNQLESTLDTNLVQKYTSSRKEPDLDAKDDVIMAPTPTAIKKETKAKKTSPVKDVSVKEPEAETISEPVSETKTILLDPIGESGQASHIKLKRLVEEKIDAAHLNNLRQKPVEDLKRAIGLNEKFLYIRELFNNDHQDFAAVIDGLNEQVDMKSAENFIQNKVRSALHWDSENEHVLSFLSIVYRKFI